MTDPMVRQDAGLFRALGVGARAARRSGSLWGFGLALQGSLEVARLSWVMLAGAMASDAFLRAAARADPERDVVAALAHGFDAMLVNRVVLPVVGLGLMLEVLAAVLRAFYLGAAVDWLAACAKEGALPTGGVVVHGAAALARAIAAFIWLAFIELVVGLWRWVALGAAFLVVTGAFALEEHGLRAALFAGVVAGLLGLVALANAVFARVYLVRAIRGPASALAAVAEALELLEGRALTYLGLWAAQLSLGLVVATIAGAPAMAGAGAGTDYLGLQVGLRLVGVVIAAALGAGVELLLLGAVCAIDLDSRGELPLPPARPLPSPPPEPVLEAQAILVAEALPIPPEPAA